MNFLSNCPGEKLLTSPQDLPLKERTFLTLMLNSIVYIFWKYEYYVVPTIAFYLFTGLSICYSIQFLIKYFGLQDINMGGQNQIGKSCLQFFTDPEKTALAIKGTYVHGYSKLNTFIGYVRKLVLLQDISFSIKVFTILYLVMRLAIILGDFGFIFLFINWFCWQEKFAALFLGFYKAIVENFEKVNKLIPVYKEQEQQQ